MGGDGTRFGKYKLLHRIASGGMGEVHLAKLLGPSGFEKLVVVKRLLNHRQGEQRYIDMFFSEARVAAQLGHSNIVQIYEVGNYDGVHYIAMEYVRGKSLRRIIDAAYERYGIMPPAYVALILIELCAGLSFAHDARHLSGAPMGVIHRDINPHNILVSYLGEIKLIDFGIAKSELTLEQTRAGTIKGTVVYMSPEQSAGLKLDRRSDIFSLGICLYEALTGDNPFYKDTVAASLSAIRVATYPPLADKRPDLLPFAPILAKTLARSAEDRYRTCNDFADALQLLLDRNAVPRPMLTLSEWLRGLFAEDIAEEERLLSRTERADIQELTPPDDETARTVYALDQEEPTLAEKPTAVSSAPAASPPAAAPPEAPQTAAVSPPLQAFFTAQLRRLWADPTARLVSIPIGVLAATLLLWRLNHPAGPPEDLPDATRPAVAARSAPVTSEHFAPSPAEPSALVENPDAGGDSDTDTSPRAGVRRPGANHRRVRPRMGRAESAELGAMGLLLLQLDPDVRVSRAGDTSGLNIKLSEAEGSVLIGSGSDAQKDPFVTRLRYRIDNRGITYDLECDPWANVSGPGGILLGRTPLRGVSGSSLTVFELRNPRLGTQRIHIRFVTDRL